MKKTRKSRLRKLFIWLLIDLGVAAVLISLLLHKPARYRPVLPPAGADPNEQRVHRYLTHELGNTLYNGAQRQQPFEMIVLGNRLNEAISQAGWLEESAGIKLSAPAIVFTPGRVVLMGAADLESAKFVITVEISPQFTEDGHLNLFLEKVKVGVMNVTWLARKMGRKMYRDRIAAGDIDTDDWRTKIAASLLNEEPFDPVLPVEDKWIRLQGIDVIEGRLTARFVPARQP